LAKVLKHIFHHKAHRAHREKRFNLNSISAGSAVSVVKEMRAAKYNNPIFNFLTSLFQVGVEKANGKKSIGND
jgi:hypothetical protein